MHLYRSNEVINNKKKGGEEALVNVVVLKLSLSVMLVN